jgi:hypothetical protein
MGERDLIEADEIEAELIERELARRDFALFCEYVYGWPAHAVPMHDEWQAHLQRCWAQNKGAGIMAPRYHGKTQQLARALPVFELGRSTEPDLAWCPNIRINLFQHVDDKAEETLGQIKVDIESNEALHQLFPRLEPDYKRGWKQNAIYVKRTENVREPSMAAHGILSSLTSGRSDLTIGDDWCSLKTSLQEPASRKRVVQAYTSDVVNLGLEGHTRMVNIGTAWSEADLNSMLQTDPELSQDWEWLIYRVQDEPGDPMQVLWPGVWETEQLEARRRKIGEREFERGFNNSDLGTEADGHGDQVSGAMVARRAPGREQRLPGGIGGLPARESRPGHEGRRVHHGQTEDGPDGGRAGHGRILRERRLAHPDEGRPRREQPALSVPAVRVAPRA